MSCFIDVADHVVPSAVDFWEPVVVPRAQIEAEVARLAAGLPPADGRRESLIVHPHATPGNGLAPGIRVTLSVLRPGESTEPIRDNSTQVSFCIAGGGTALIGDRKIDFGRHHVCNHPAWTTYSYANYTDATQVRLTYSNSALLDCLGVHLVEKKPADSCSAIAAGTETALAQPPDVDTEGLHWPRIQLEQNLEVPTPLGGTVPRRRQRVLPNQVTALTDDAAPNFFATMIIRPPGSVDQPHQNASAAISYYLRGSGHSLVGGKRYDWSAGDLMFSAPGWAVQYHASGPDEHVYELAVRDQPFHQALQSALRYGLPGMQSM